MYSGKSETHIVAVGSLFLFSSFRAPGRKNLYNVLGRHEAPSFADLNLFEDEQQPSTVIWKFLSNIQQRPLETTLSSFAKFNDYLCKFFLSIQYYSVVLAFRLGRTRSSSKS
jgi:hypothetical protein